MKVIALILSIFLFALSIIPCSDGETCEAEQKEISDSQEHDHSKDSTDHCSPFCICACCSVSVPLEEEIAGTNYLHPGFEEGNASYSFIYAFTYLQAVWRPPSHC